MAETKQGSSMWDVVSSLPLNRAAVVVFVAADTVCLGALVLFLLAPSLFFSLPLAKLLLLSASLTVPVVALGTIAFQIGVARLDYSKLSEGLDTSIVYSVFLHLLWILAALSAYGLSILFPYRSVPWMPTGGLPVFWMFSGLYVLQTVSVGVSQGIERPWIKWIFPGVLIANGIAVVIYKAIHT